MSRMDVLTDKELKEVIDSSKLVRKYNETIDRESAYELLNVKIERAEKLAEEEKRFKLGRSNSDTLIRYHDDLLIAKISLADSLYQYNSDFIDLRLKENSLLDE